MVSYRHPFGGAKPGAIPSIQIDLTAKMVLFWWLVCEDLLYIDISWFKVQRESWFLQKVVILALFGVQICFSTKLHWPQRWRGWKTACFFNGLAHLDFRLGHGRKFGKEVCEFIKFFWPPVWIQKSKMFKQDLTFDLQGRRVWMNDLFGEGFFSL